MDRKTPADIDLADEAQRFQNDLYQVLAKNLERLEHQTGREHHAAQELLTPMTDLYRAYLIQRKEDATP